MTETYKIPNKSYDKTFTAQQRIAIKSVDWVEMRQSFN